MFIAHNQKYIITAVSEYKFQISGQKVVEILPTLPKHEWHKIIGTRLDVGQKRTPHDLRVAFICNWGDNCGISTYTKFLVDAMRPKVKELKIFSEIVPDAQDNPADNVQRCWHRGQSMKTAVDAILEWNPDFIIVQHEFGLFPKATYFLQLLQLIEDIPYVVTMHSVYEHLDKSVCSAAIKHIVVHSEEGKKVLRKTGNSSVIDVIPHGCIQLPAEEKGELWNIFQTPYALVQFGFGFYYKGVDRVLDAIHYLKSTDPKFKDIFYCYLCSENPHTNLVHLSYYEFLLNKIKELNLHDNVAIIKKFQTEQTINSYLRTAKIALFPYVSDPKNTVYGASGAIRVAMANGTPVIASSCHQFDDLEGVVPRPHDYLSLARTIDTIFSQHLYRAELLKRADEYIRNNTWDISADRYLNLYFGN